MDATPTNLLQSDSLLDLLVGQWPRMGNQRLAEILPHYDQQNYHFGH